MTNELGHQVQVDKLSLFWWSEFAQSDDAEELRIVSNKPKPKVMLKLGRHKRLGSTYKENETTQISQNIRNINNSTIFSFKLNSKGHGIFYRIAGNVNNMGCTSKLN